MNQIGLNSGTLFALDFPCICHATFRIEVTLQSGRIEFVPFKVSVKMGIAEFSPSSGISLRCRCTKHPQSQCNGNSTSLPRVESFPKMLPAHIRMKFVQYFVGTLREA